jgi:hypothetical protein
MNSSAHSPKLPTWTSEKVFQRFAQLCHYYRYPYEEVGLGADYVDRFIR